MKLIFVDTGGWIAVAVRRDRFHTAAKAYAHELAETGAALLTTNYVLIETYTRIRYDDGHAAAVAFDNLIQELVNGRRLTLTWVTPRFHERALEVFHKYADQKFSLVDCASFVVARDRGIRDVFGFDKNFLTMGFVLRPVPVG